MLLSDAAVRDAEAGAACATAELGELQARSDAAAAALLAFRENPSAELLAARRRLYDAERTERHAAERAASAEAASADAESAHAVARERTAALVAAEAAWGWSASRRADAAAMIDVDGDLSTGTRIKKVNHWVVPSSNHCYTCGSMDCNPNVSFSSVPTAACS